MIHQGALGDFILTLPAVIQLRKYYQPIDVLGHSQMGKLAAALNLVDSWFSANTREFASLYSDQADSKIVARLNKYEKIILFTISNQLDQSIRSVTAGDICQMPPKPPVHQRTHVSRFVLENVCYCGLITATDAEFDKIQLREYGVAKRDRHKILLHPGAGSIRKRWPLDNFLRLASELNSAGLKTEFVLGPAEEALGESLRNPGLTVHVLEDLLGLLDLLNTGGGYIGNDSGATHLAAFCGLPTTVIFGPADPGRWTPVGRAVEVVRPALDCRPCFEIEEDNCDAQNCLVDISPEMVMNAFLRVYSRYGMTNGDWRLTNMR